MKAAIFLLLSFGISFHGVASALEGDCHSFLTGGGRYCIYKGTDNPDVLFYFHGNGLNETTWGEEFYYTSQIRKYWSDNELKAPTAVSVSFGDDGLISEKNSSQFSGSFENFTTQGLQEIEARLGGIKGRRILLGESMGGFNSVQLALKTDLFAKAAILCSPMAAGVTPFSSSEAVQAYLEKTSVWQYFKAKHANTDVIAQTALKISIHAKKYFPTEQDWKNADPVSLSSVKTSKTSFYVSSGYYDSFASFEGNEKFVKNLKAHGVAVDWRPHWGGHCAIDINSLGSFLVQ